MDRVIQMVRQIPPISRSWLALAIVVSILNSNNILPTLKFMFLPGRIGVEPWRILVLFCYFGPLSLLLIIHLINIRDAMSALESGFINDESVLPEWMTTDLDELLRDQLNAQFERHRVRDFAYFLGQMATTITLEVYIIYRLFGYTGPSLVFLGPILHDSIVYTWGKTYPEAEMFLLLVPLRAKYTYWMLEFIHFLISPDFFDVVRAYKVGFLMGLYKLFTYPSTVKVMVVVLVAHFWWFMRSFITESMYNDTKTASRRNWKNAYNEIAPGMSTRNVYCRIVQVVLTPPWYWLISRSIRSQQRIRAILAARMTELEAEVNVEANAEANAEAITHGEGDTGDIADD